MRRFFILFICTALISVGGCARNTLLPEIPESMEAEQPEEQPQDETAVLAIDSSAEPAKASALVAGVPELGGSFPAFAAENEQGGIIAELVLGPTLIACDRYGGLVLNGIKGETHEYNGKNYRYTSLADAVIEYGEDTTVYRIKLREGVKFSDGVEMTAADLIFTYYVLCDPSYTGANALGAVDIQGLRKYRQGYLEEQARLKNITDAIILAGSGWTGGPAKFTEEQYNSFWAEYNGSLNASLQAIVNYCRANFPEFAADIAPEAESLEEEYGLRVALGMYAWGYADPLHGGGIVTAAGGEFDLRENFPTIQDFIAALYVRFPGGYEEASNAGEFENVPGAVAYDSFIGAYLNEAAGSSPMTVRSISGIKKLGDYEIEITVNGRDASAARKLLCVRPVPLHYYGTPGTFGVEEESYGFQYGNTGSLGAKDFAPMGAGPYKFVKYENRTAHLEANENYWKGVPKIRELQVKAMNGADAIDAITDGTADITVPNADLRTVNRVKRLNGGSLSGPVIEYREFPGPAYGYIGINAKNVSVGGKRGSAASINLRLGLATIFAVYRELSVSGFYGESASVLNYPVPEALEAAPKRGEDGYMAAYSKDVDSNGIYDASADGYERFRAAEHAALGYFNAAGYEIKNGKIIKSPPGGRASFEIWVPANGEGDHPSYQLLAKAKESLGRIGIELIIRDFNASGELRNGLYTETVDMWCATREVEPDPDFYLLYHSAGLIGKGIGSNIYGTDDRRLDALIDALRSGNTEREVYREALETILAWGVEVPVYQREGARAFSAERVNTAALPDDMTVYYGWIPEVEKLKLR